MLVCLMGWGLLIVVGMMLWFAYLVIYFVGVFGGLGVGVFDYLVVFMEFTCVVICILVWDLVVV